MDESKATKPTPTQYFDDGGIPEEIEREEAKEEEYDYLVD